MNVNKIINKIIGYALLSPALYCVGRYFILVVWSKTTVSSTGEDTTVIWFGLMAIAGAYLIKDKN